MTLEIVLSGANLIALLAFVVRWENRLTKMETLVNLLVARSGLNVQGARS